MMHLQPTETLDWVNRKGFNRNNYSNHNPIGCFLDVDLDYPDELHGLQNNYALAGEKIKSNRKSVAQISVTNHKR